MKQVYACILGQWVNLHDDPNCIMVVHNESPKDWILNSCDVYAPKEKDREEFNHYKYLDYILISYKGKTYRINPIFIQVIEEGQLFL